MPSSWRWRVWSFKDSYQHYRNVVKLGRAKSIYRALYYETKGKEPWA